MSPLAVSQDAQLVNTVKKVESVVSRLRKRPNHYRMATTTATSSSSTATTSNIDPSLSLVEKAQMLKLRASRIARRVQVDKTDETASTSESLTRSAIFMSLEDSGVTWYKEPTAYDVYGEI